MGEIKKILMERDGISSTEADKLIEFARLDLEKRLANPGNYDDPFDVCQDHFGLEPDYLMELI